VSDEYEVDASVVSLDDRRKIRALEAANADLERKLAEARGQLKPQLERTFDADHCMHAGGFWVSDNLEQIRCKICESVINPYEALRKIAHRETNFCYTLNSLRTEVAELTKQRDRLKGQTSRLKTAKRKAEDPPVATIEAFKKEFDLQGIGFMWLYGGLEIIARTKVTTAARAGTALSPKDHDLRAVGETVTEALDNLRILLERNRNAASK
jgi:hypothetical protein